jgi:transposase
MSFGSVWSLWLAKLNIHRRVRLDIRTGLPWRDLPEEFGYWHAEFRRIATSYDKLGSSFFAAVHLAAAFIFLKNS